VKVVETARLKERAKERPKGFDSKQGLLLVFKRFPERSGQNGDRILDFRGPVPVFATGS
jgi:hypothetical protein